MSETPTKTAHATLDSLEARLRKVQWYLSGNDGDKVEDTLRGVRADDTVQARLVRLEKDLGKLSSRSAVVRDLLKLRWYPLSNCIFLTNKALINRCFLSRSLSPYNNHRRPHHPIYARNSRNRQLHRSFLPTHCLPSQRHQRPAHPPRRSICFIDLATATITEARAFTG